MSKTKLTKPHVIKAAKGKVKDVTGKVVQEEATTSFFDVNKMKKKQHLSEGAR